VNNSLERLTEGIVATLRASVIPNVSDPYARGQAIGVIDLLNNLMPRLEWARAPLVEAVAHRRAALREALSLLPAAPIPREPPANWAPEAANASELAAERDRLDGEIADLVVWAHGPDASGDIEPAIALLRRHVHQTLADEMKMTRKPLFAEIAKGAEGEKGKRQD
jgi:hypothetical protein